MAKDEAWWPLKFKRSYEGYGFYAVGELPDGRDFHVFKRDDSYGYSVRIGGLSDISSSNHMNAYHYPASLLELRALLMNPPEGSA